MKKLLLLIALVAVCLDLVLLLVRRGLTGVWRFVLLGSFVLSLGSVIAFLAVYGPPFSP